MADLCILCSLSGPGIREGSRILILLGALSWAAWTDLRGRRISNHLILSMLCTGGMLLVLESSMDKDWTRLSEAMTGFLLGGGLCFCCYLLFRKGIGAGDVKLFAVTGFYLGRTEILPMLALSVFLAAGACAFMLILGKADRHTRVPYAPFIFLAVFIGMLEKMEWNF